MIDNTDSRKHGVRQFWEDEACGERYALGATELEGLQEQARKKYELEPYIPAFARFDEGRGKRVLEVGVGMGVDHSRWAQSEPAYLAGVDLTEKAIGLTGTRLASMRLKSELRVADAERLPFADECFDIVYSWGVLHHTPDTRQSVREVWRVLRPGGVARIMLYRKYGVLFMAIWARFALKDGFHSTIEEVISKHVESPGTKVYAAKGVQELFSLFRSVSIRPALSHGDLLEGDVGARHRGYLLRLTKSLWPRRLLRSMPPFFGSIWLIEAVK